MRKSMLTLLFFLGKLALSTVLIYFAYHLPGKQKTTLSIMDHMVDLETGRLVAGIFIVVILGHYLWKLLRYLAQLPARTKKYLETQRLLKSKQGAWNSYVALASGEVTSAYEMAERAYSQDSSNVLARIIAAQSLLKQSIAKKQDPQDQDLQDVEIRFQALLREPQTRFLALQGLVHIKKSQQRWGEVYSLLKEALSYRPDSVWALNELLFLTIQDGNFDQASEYVQLLKDKKGLSREQAASQQGVLFYLKAKRELSQPIDGFDSDFENQLAQGLFQQKISMAEEYLVKALKNEPSLTAATLLLSLIYGSTNRFSKAQSCLLKGYAAFPCREYLEGVQRLFRLSSCKSTLSTEKYKFVEEMVASHPQDPSSHFILATVALEAKLWGQARLYLSFLKMKQPTQSYYRLLSELESSEPPYNAEKAKEILKEGLLADPDPAWFCQSCQTRHKSWRTLCSQCHGFDILTLEK